MIRIESGSRDIWPGFALEIERELVFAQGEIWQLKGPNGSGKSSFISRLLMPLLKLEDAYVLHFEQQASLQLQAVKAWAAIFHPGRPVRDEDELVSYLLDDLADAYARQPKPVWIVADEIHRVERALQNGLPCCLIYCAHHKELEGTRALNFEPLSPARSRVYA